MRKKRQDGSKIILSFFGDGPLCDNLVHIPSLPSGMTYFRPFRYRTKWIGRNVQRELEAPEARRKLIGEKAILAIRFCADEYTQCVLPWREVTITHIDFIYDNVSVYFSLGSFYTWDETKPLKSQCLPVREQGQFGTELFFKGGKNCCPDVALGPEEESWITCTERIAKDDSLPFGEKARRAVFFRISGLRRKGAAAIGPIYRSWKRGPVGGFHATEARRYELVFLHRVPFLLDKNSSIPEFEIKPIAGTSNWEFSSHAERISGNYQLHTITMSALEPSAAWEEVELSPSEDTLGINAGEVLYVLPVRFNVRISMNWWHRLLTKYIWIILLGLFVVLKDVCSAILEGEEYKREAIIGGLAFLVLILGYAVSQKKLLK